MKAALADFNAGVDQLVVFLERTDREQELIALLNDRKSSLPARESVLLDTLVAASTNTKQYIYAVAVVSLYGLLERLVDSVVIGFVAHLGEFCKTYDELPEVIRKNHLPQSLALAEALLKDRFRTETTHEQIIANLHSCLSGDRKYKLNGSAFALHRANVSLGRISDILNGVGAQHHMRRVVRTPTLFQFLQSLEPERDVRAVADADIQALLEPIDDLVGRRNDVSHGVVQIDEIQSVALLIERCNFVRAYGTGLYEVLLQDALKYAAEIGVAQPLGKPIAIYNNMIACFEACCQLAVGDQLFAVTKDVMEPVRWSAIVSLQIDRIDQREIIARAPVKFGARVTFHAGSGHQYFCLPAGLL